MSKRILFMFTMLVLFAISCEEAEIKNNQSPQPGTTDFDPAGRVDVLKDPGGVAQSGTCGGSYSGTYTTINSYYTYSARTIDVSCAAVGATISISYDAVEIPNRFTVKTNGGSTVAYSGWAGYASYGGPWGSSLSASTTGYLTFTKTAGNNTYQLVVETLTPPNNSYNPNTDAWYASASCTCPPPTCSPACGPGYTCVSGACVCNIACGGSFSGNYNTISSYYTYPARTFDVTCAATGATIYVSFDAVEIPNRFTIKTAGGSTVAYTGWRGYASYSGPWGGSSLSTAASGYLTFTKTAGNNSYQLIVETLTPPNNSYNPNTDAWYASVSCP